MPGSVGAVLVERPASIEEVFCFSLIQVDLTRFFNRVSARTLQLFITTVTRLLVPTMSYTTSSCPGVLLFFECRLLHSDVYSSVYSYIHIYKKLPFLADFIKNWVHFIKKLRCDKFGNLSISTKTALNNQIQSSMKIYMYIVC